jgi:hypothetical protein
MTLGNVFGILVVLSLTAGGVAMARDISGGTASAKGKAVHLVKGDPAHPVKGDKAGAKTAVVPVTVRHVKPQAPIVMGRSVSLHHKTKLHHVKMKPLESADLPISTGGSD